MSLYTWDFLLPLNYPVMHYLSQLANYFFLWFVLERWWIIFDLGHEIKVAYLMWWWNQYNGKCNFGKFWNLKKHDISRDGVNWRFGSIEKRKVYIYSSDIRTELDHKGNLVISLFCEVCNLKNLFFPLTEFTVQGNCSTDRDSPLSRFSYPGFLFHFFVMDVT